MVAQAVVEGEVAVPLPPLLLRLDSGQDVGDRSGSDQDVDLELVGDRLALVELGKAAHQGQIEVSTRPPLLAELPEQRDHLLDRLAAHGAGVEDDQLGVFGMIDQLVASSNQLGLDGVGVVLVHLTPVGDDVRANGEDLPDSSAGFGPAHNNTAARATSAKLASERQNPISSGLGTILRTAAAGEANISNTPARNR